jgi:hypothetical protein
VVAGAWLWEGRVSWGRSKRIALLLVPIALLSAFFVIQSWSRIGGLTGSGIEVILNWWRSAGAQWSQNRLWSQSDWTRRLLSSIPSWAVLPFFTTYGLIRPFLPAGIIDSGIPLWRTIAIWRGLGWFAMLPFLLYAPFAAIKQRGWRSLETYLALLVWITAIAASYRGTGDQWDNPRYRAVFLLPQVALAGWVWVEARQGDSPWFNRLVGLVALTTGLFTLWYARRYAWAPQVSVLQAITVIAAITLLTVMAMLLYDFVRARRSGA